MWKSASTPAATPALRFTSTQQREMTAWPRPTPIDEDVTQSWLIWRCLPSMPESVARDLTTWAIPCDGFAWRTTV